MDALILSRLQFGLNISFHILFPTITIALAWFLFFFKLRHDISRAPVWMRIYRFWVKIFALTFALGVVSGITMSFQFGTNWPGFMQKAGNIAGPLLGYEVLSAFFLEATFLGIMLFGIRLVPGWVHTLAAFMVAIGTSLSAFWILALNSWMHTPAGHVVIDGIIYPQNWWQVIFNPSLPYRLTHMLLASGLTACFLLIGLSAFRLLKGDTKQAPQKTLRIGIVVAALLVPLQILVGDMHGLNTLKHQPQKVAAMEGLWQSTEGAPLLLFAWPDETRRQNRWAIEIPSGASMILTHDANGFVQGLDDFVDEHPPVAPVFFSFRVMIATGLLMLAVAWFGLYQRLRHRPFSKPYLRICTAMTFSGWLATLAGWYVTEMGRQPYLVSGLLRTSEAVTQTSTGNVGLSLALYLTVYALLLVAYIRALFRIASKAKDVEEIGPEETSYHPFRIAGQETKNV